MTHVISFKLNYIFHPYYLFYTNSIYLDYLIYKHTHTELMLQNIVVSCLLVVSTNSDLGNTDTQFSKNRKCGHRHFKTDELTSSSCHHVPNLRRYFFLFLSLLIYCYKLAAVVLGNARHLQKRELELPVIPDSCFPFIRKAKSN